LATQAGADWLTFTPPGGPEELFRIGGTPQADGGVLLSMPAGDWLRGADGSAASAALGVLVDDALGNSIIERRPANSWPVSTEISVDYVSWPPPDGLPVQARSRVLSAPPAGALAAGEVTDSAGAVLAVATSRFHFVPGEPAVPRGPVVPGEPGGDPGRRTEPGALAQAGPASLLALLGADLRGDATGATLTLPAGPHLANPRGFLHGGIALCASQLAGERALSAGGSLPATAIRIAYVRPVVLSGTLSVTARVLHGGRSFGVAQVTVTGPTGKPGTVATVTCQRA
jgi:uncharacterized protein (TIGR00369 family)